jgi:O-antigen ligase
VGDALKIKWTYIIGGIYILLNAVTIYFELYYFALLPVALLVLWAAIFKLEYLLLFITFCTPFSLNLEDMDVGGIGFYLPTEPLLFGVLFIMLFKVLSGQSLDHKVFRHPISIIIYLYLAWTFLTSITSQLPLVSFKFLVAKLWFIVPFFFVAAHIFKKKKNIRYFQYLYLLPLIGVITYTIVRHASYGFEKDAGHWVMDPFYKDHTSYGAVLAMYIPVVFGLLARSPLNTLLRISLMGGSVIMTMGFILSFTRAAWISLVAAVIVMLLMFLKVRFSTLLTSLVLLLGFTWYAQHDLLIMLEKNKQDSSDNLAEHVESISNVSSDASNLERLNRWNCAIEMFMEHPVVGWGPGTYQFVYAPFQRSQDLTIISTNNADGGNAHSEYLGPLSEQGVPGAVIFLVLIFAVCKMSFRLYYSLEDREIKILVLTTFMGLLTYFIHGVLNNYLDTDKASVPFWGFIAILVAVDLYYKKLEKPAT